MGPGKMQVSRRATSLAQSATTATMARARQLAAAGVDIVNFGIGEPDMEVPDAVKRKTIEAVKKNITKYPPTQGRQDLREAISRKLKRDNSLGYSPDQIVVSSGAKQSLYSAMLATLNPLDEVIIIKPYWVSYPEQVKLCGAVPVIVDSGPGFIPSADAVWKRITKRTRMIILNSPNNPTGAVYGRKALYEIARLAVENDIMVLSDEIYEHLIYEGRHVSIASLNSRIRDLTVTINGLSKSHAMTGYRIGYAAAAPEIVQAMVRIQSHTSGPSSISQYAALAALDGGYASIRSERETFRRRRKLVMDELAKVPGLSVAKPAGTFYVFPDISAACKSIHIAALEKRGGKSASRAFSEGLLDREGVVTVPGSAFGDDRCIRISYTIPEERIIEGIDRIRRFVS